MFQIRYGILGNILDISDDLKGDAISIGGDKSSSKLSNLEFDWIYKALIQNISNDDFSAHFTI
ncbi:hypothetical protein [Bacillus cereus group sp. BfR-BA-01380]|uniref:hypothetical protein n=1 Tax=Bacillus cereus group sp. BfR-BA-01380 TaxID=2920324 RepID=UPI001F5A2D73|nr:hypothetical protein [Bacillus cereus group sp. BfR-BA-01380]